MQEDQDSILQFKDFCLQAFLYFRCMTGLPIYDLLEPENPTCSAT